MRSVASLTPDWHPGRIVRRNGVRTLSVRAFPSGGRLSSQVLADAQKQIAKLQLPSGYHIEYGGEFENQEETFGEMSYALLISLILIFLILLFQFRTLSDTLIVIAAIPLAVPGAALGLLITNNPFGFTAFIGLISLGGLAVRNSIILVDYIHERMKHGIALEQATLEAGERRLRPIFLTTMAAAVGVTPMIISRSSLWSPLASVIAFGLLGSMFFTLIVIPVLFVVVNKRRLSKSAVGALTTIAMLVFVMSAHAQERQVTLDEALQMAMQKNSTVRLASLKAKEADAKVVQARSNYFPTVSNQSNVVHSEKTESLTIPHGILGTYDSVGDLPGKDAKIKLGKQDFIVSQTTVALPITQVFKIHSGVSAAEADARIAHNDAERARNEVALNVKKLYYGLLSAHERKRALELRIEAGEEHLHEARSAAESGVALKVKVLEGQAQIADARHQLGRMEDEIADMQSAFNDLVGLPLLTDTQLLEPDGKMEDAVPSDVVVTEADTVAMMHNHELLSAMQALSKAHAGLNAARAEYIPDVSVFAQHVYQNGAPLLPTSSAAFGVRMDWTILEFGKRIGLVRERKTQVAQANENLHAVENKVRMNIQTEVRKVRRADTGLQSAKQSVAARAELLRIITDEVEAKTATQASLKDAKAQLADAKAQLFDAEMQRIVSIAELLRTEGRQ